MPKAYTYLILREPTIESLVRAVNQTLAENRDLQPLGGSFEDHNHSFVPALHEPVPPRIEVSNRYLHGTGPF